MCYCNECSYCESPILAGDEVIHLGETLFHLDCFASYNDEMNKIIAETVENDIDGDSWTCYVDESDQWPDGWDLDPIEDLF